jgi:opacity protein-like surface antigen
MSRLLKTVFVVLVIAAFANVSQAQDDANIIRPSTKSGSAAWLFDFGGLSTLGMASMPIASTPVGGTVAGAGLKMYLADDLALRAILGFSMASDGDAGVAGGTEHANTAIGIAVGIEMHTHDVYSTSPYFGAQLAFATVSHKTTTNGSPNVEVTNSGSSFGIGVLAGFDWYFTRGIAVGAEYNLGFSSMSESAESSASTTNPDIPGSTFIGISNSGNVHLVVHF